MSVWQVKPFMEFADVIGGGTPKTTIESYWNGDIPWLSVKDFGNDDRYVYKTEKSITQMGLNNSSTKLLQKDDIIISARGTVGEIAMIPSPMAFNQSCYGIRGKDGIDKTFLYYLLKYSISLLKGMTHGSVFDTITRDTFANLMVKVPDHEIQKKIADILTSLDDKIDINKKINDNLQQQAQTIFKQEFISSDILPVGWRKGCLLDIADYLNGLAMQKFRPKDDEVGLPVLKIKELRQGMCDSNSELCSPNIKLEYVIHDGDVIFSWSGSLLVDFWCGDTCGLNQHLFKVTSKQYDKWFYYTWTNYHLQKFIAIAADMATTMGHIKREELSKSEVLIPSSEDYIRIGELLQPIYDLIITNRIENRKLASLRDELLPQLMSGELDISEVSL